MMPGSKHKVPFKVRFYRMKNTGFPRIIDKLIENIKPPKSCKEKPGEILFIRNDKIGDALVTIPVLRDLKLNNPSLVIDVLCSEINSFIFKNLDFINKIHIYENYSSAELEYRIKAEKYGAIVDLVSRDKKFVMLLRRCSPFTAGSRLFGFSWLYDYYLPTNWVSESDSEPMSFKIEKLLNDCFAFKFIKRDISLPYNKKYNSKPGFKEFDILFHLGTSEIRKLDFESEKNLINEISKKRLLITDGHETERFKYYRAKFGENENIKFKLYDNIEGLEKDVKNSKLVLCYDGGQAHFMGQFNRCLVLAGSISPLQWAPYDFSRYTLLKSWDNGVNAIISNGEMKHIGLYRPIWCLPCYNLGCNNRPCINSIEPAQVIEIIRNYTDVIF